MHVGEGGGEKGTCVWGEGGEGCVCVCGGVRGGKSGRGGRAKVGGRAEVGGKFKVQICRCGILTMKITVLLPPHFW